jgi:hypothetical protein
VLVFSSGEDGLWKKRGGALAGGAEVDRGGKMEEEDEEDEEDEDDEEEEEEKVCG